MNIIKSNKDITHIIGCISLKNSSSQYDLHYFCIYRLKMKDGTFKKKLNGKLDWTLKEFFVICDFFDYDILVYKKI